MSGWVWAGVAALGGAGAVARFLVDAGGRRARVGQLPARHVRDQHQRRARAGLLAGLAASAETVVLAGGATLGSYTTFSTWMLESHRLAEDGEPPRSALNVLASALVGVGAAALGHTIGARL